MRWQGAHVGAPGNMCEFLPCAWSLGSPTDTKACAQSVLSPSSWAEFLPPAWWPPLHPIIWQRSNTLGSRILFKAPALLYSSVDLVALKHQLYDEYKNGSTSKKMTQVSYRCWSLQISNFKSWTTTVRRILLQHVVAMQFSINLCLEEFFFTCSL